MNNKFYYSLVQLQLTSDQLPAVQRNRRVLGSSPVQACNFIRKSLSCCVTAMTFNLRNFHLCDPGSILSPEVEFGPSISESHSDSEGFSPGTQPSISFLPFTTRVRINVEKTIQRNKLGENKQA